MGKDGFYWLKMEANPLMARHSVYMIACISADALLCNNLLSTALIGLFTLMSFPVMSNKSTDINK